MFYTRCYVALIIMITIKVERDKSCEMARVNDGVGNGMEGNFWDFHNGCHGLYEFDSFINPERMKSRTDFWWDISNDLMFWRKNPEFELKFKSIITTNPS